MYQPTCETRSSARFPALPGILQRWAMWSSLLMLCGCSATLPVVGRPDPAPAALTAECQPGPAYPEGDARLAAVLEIVAAREVAAAECRARHRGLSEWARKVTQ